MTWNLDIFEAVFKALQDPSRALTVLKLYLTDTETTDSIPPLSVQYLGGATHLRSLSLAWIPLPGLRNLLLSSADLVDLRLMLIPLSICSFPDEMVAALSALTRLQVFHFEPEFDKFHPYWKSRHLSLPTRTVLPSLIELRFEGVIDYLDDFMSRIDAPLLGHLDIVASFILDSVMVFNNPHILRFINRVPKLQAFDEAHIGGGGFKVWINFLSTRASSGVLNLVIYCMEPVWQFPCLAQFCRSPFFPLPTLKHLYRDGGKFLRDRSQDDMEITRWQELLRPFTSVKNLYLSEDYIRRIAPALEELGGERATEVLPALENVLIENFWVYGSVREEFRNVATMRQLSGVPIVVSEWDRSGREAGH